MKESHANVVVLQEEIKFPNIKNHHVQKSIDYVQRNRNKKVIYRSFVTNSYTNTTPGSSFNVLVNSCIVHPTAVLICPFIA